MDHHARIAVIIAQEVVDRQVCNDLILVHNVIQVFLRIQLFQGVDQTIFISFVNVCFGVLKNVAVAVRIVV